MHFCWLVQSYFMWETKQKNGDNLSIFTQLGNKSKLLSSVKATSSNSVYFRKCYNSPIPVSRKYTQKFSLVLAT